MVKNKVQLITYGDCLGNNLKDLHFVLTNFLKDYIGGVHILPFYPSSADRGFAPLTHLEVDSKFGSWDDVKKISGEFDLMVDLVANHISSESIFFKDFLINGEKSNYADMFLTVDKVFPDSVIDEKEMEKIYRPRPTSPLVPKLFGDGKVRHVWCSFTDKQIDINWNSYVTKDIMREFLIKLCENGANVIRLDAVGYIMKKIGTNSFFIPEVYDIIRWIGEVTGEFDVKFLPEVHSHYSLQLDIASKSDYVYDFALPALVLHALYFGTTLRLKKWLDIRPKNQFTTLDTHDGIGTVDVEGLLMDDEREKLIETLYLNGGNATLRASGGNSENVDVYQVNCTYYSALKCNDKSYVAARAIQFFVPGIPQVYYVGLFAGMNDSQLVEKTNIGRDINRHFYTIDEIRQQMERNVVKNIFSLMKFRNEYPAFNGKFEMSETPDNILFLSWKKDEFECNLDVDLQTFDLKISYKEKIGDIFEWKELELIEMEDISFEAGKRLVPESDGNESSQNVNADNINEKS